MQPTVYHASNHDIDPSAIDHDAVYIVNKLKEAGFVAYLVGGSVRDLLLKRIPKDYDISTSARPEEIKAIFQRSCILIGKRFRLAHIRFGHKIFEVSTFRSGDNESDLIVRDNEWGTPSEDVLRRDFTINGLFYDPHEHVVIDYVGGWEDIHKHTLRSIGEAGVRFRQDPVRMIRLLKFRARFGFEIEPPALKALTTYREEILKSSPARILEEILRMLESGASSSFFQLMQEYGLLELLFPCLQYFLEGIHGKRIFQYLEAADKLNQEKAKSPLDRSILTACLLFPILEEEIHTQFTSKDEIPHMGNIIQITTSLISGVVTSSFSQFPRRLSALMSYILTTQYRLTPIQRKAHYRPKVFQQHDFHLALTFYKLRCMVDHKLTPGYLGWKDAFKRFEKQSSHRKPHHPPPQSKEDEAEHD